MNSIFRFSESKISLETGIASFSYEVIYKDEHFFFTETLHFPIQSVKTVNPQLLKNAMDNLLLVLGISYYKLFIPQIIETPTISLSEEQASFWNTVYTKGLGEFFYTNKIDYRNHIHFPFSTDAKPHVFSQKMTNRSLLFFGGGKDSIVSAELLKKFNKPFTLFIINSSSIQQGTATIVNKESIIVKRMIDPLLLNLNKRTDAYNGHVPATAIWNFIGVVAAILFDYTYLIGSNERSANFGNVSYLGEEINHQWSKSFEFEKLFQDYIKTYISHDITYFSLLRPFHEIKIVEVFSHYPQYFPYFSSCNRNFTIKNPQTKKKWCGECPKCLFVFISLAAFLPKETVVTIFGKNLLAEKTLLPLLQELLGIKDIKPFECVGTPEEVAYALMKISQSQQYENDFLVKYAEKEILHTYDSKNLEEKVLGKDSENTITANFKDVL